MGRSAGQASAGDAGLGPGPDGFRNVASQLESRDVISSNMITAHDAREARHFGSAAEGGQIQRDGFASGFGQDTALPDLDGAKVIVAGEVFQDFGATGTDTAVAGDIAGERRSDENAG